MKVNSKEIQKFYDLWSPVLEAIPAVINSVERSEELQRGVQILEAQVQKLQQTIADTQAEIDPVRKRVNNEISQIEKLKAEAERDYKQYIADAKAHIAKIDQETDAEVGAIKSKVTAANSELRRAEQEVASNKAKAEAEAKQQKQQLDSEIAELEAKKREIESVLANLKAKLG